MSKVRHFLNLFTASWWACSFSASKGNSLVHSGQSKHSMIAKMNRACKQYKTNKLYQLLKLPLSSYYYQVKGKSLNNNINVMIKFIKQTAIELFG
jgi:hypothetical protein